MWANLIYRSDGTYVYNDIAHVDKVTHSSIVYRGITFEFFKMEHNFFENNCCVYISFNTCFQRNRLNSPINYYLCEPNCQGRALLCF